MSRRIVAIVQARMSSSRLPGKVLLDIRGQPMLDRVVERLSRASLVQDVVVATTTDPADDTLSSYCMSRSLPCCRGSQYDVLDRYYQAATAFKAEIVVRITADCPLVDADLSMRRYACCRAVFRTIRVACLVGTRILILWRTDCLRLGRAHFP